MQEIDNKTYTHKKRNTKYNKKQQKGKKLKFKKNISLPFIPTQPSLMVSVLAL